MATGPVPPESWTLDVHALAGPLSGHSVGSFCIGDAFTWGLVQSPLPGIAVEVDVR